MRVQFAELPVFDRDRAKAFYVDIFDCRLAADHGWRSIELRLAGAETALLFLRRGDEAPSTKPVLVFVDDDVETQIARRRNCVRAAKGALATRTHGCGVSGR
jgi:predicted enzyme related to lactoylglutathione lyase